MPVMSEARPTVDLLLAAQRCRDRLAGDGALGPHDVARLEHLVVTVDQGFCRAVADRFDAAPPFEWTGPLERGYACLVRDIRIQYETLSTAGVTVEPWLGPGQPYRDAGDLVDGVRGTGVLHVFLTRDGHGPPGNVVAHPLRRPAGVTVRGVALTHNDLFRAVHDVFGHVLFGRGFGLSGELEAAYCQMALSSPEARPVMFAEQVAQTCWFFLGPHVRDRAGRVRRPGDPGYVPPHRRPYPEQKVIAVGPRWLDAFAAMFTFEEPS
jgi:hypothetical protein